MQYNDLQKEYKKTQVNTASQGKLIVMMYDGAVKFINNAIEFMSKNDIEKTHNNILKAQDIITELTTSLNIEAGEIAHRLFGIYMYISQKLTEANVKKDTKPLIEVKKYLMDLREAWNEASKKAGGDSNNANKGGVNIAT